MVLSRLLGGVVGSLIYRNCVNCMYIYKHIHIYIYIHTWIYENIAPEILPYVSFPCEIFFIYRFFFVFFFLHFSFDPKSISRKHTLADIYKIKIA